MKRKLVDTSDWKRILEKRYKQTFIENENYKGYISILYIDKVKEPFIVTLDNKKYCLADEGYIWVKYVPEESNYAVLGIYDKDENLIEWYFDVIKGTGITDEGKLYFDDLYLDIVVYPTGEIQLLDEDELEEALNDGIITKEEYDLAYKETKRLMKEIEEGKNHIINNSEKYFEYIKDLVVT